MQIYRHTITLIRNHFSLKIEDNILDTISGSPIYLLLTVIAIVTFLMEALFFIA